MGNIITKNHEKNSESQLSNLSQPILDKEFEGDILSQYIKDDSIVFGCRSPDSKGEGMWDGAFVYIHQDMKSIGIVFENKMDFISNNLSIDNAYKIYYDFLKKEWIPMTIDDIRRTSGIICRVAEMKV